MRDRTRIILACLTLLAGALEVRAQFESQPIAEVAGTVVGQAAQGPYAALPIIVAGDRLGLAALPEVAAPVEPDAPRAVDKAEPLLAHMMDGIKDDKPLPQHWTRDQDEQRAYSIVLFEASRIPAEAFRRGARQDLTYAHVFNHPSKYRGQVIHLEGTLKQLYRYDPPATAKAAGVANLYEGWVFDDHYKLEPWCVVFTDLPKGVALGDKLNIPVSFDGYFFKRYLYESRNTNKKEHWRKAPLLIGRTLTLAATAPPAEPESDWTGSLIPIFLSLVIGSIALAFGLGWWFRRGDRQVRQRLATVTDREFIEPSSNGSSDETRIRSAAQEEVPRSTF
jgi:hypothetical protein